MRSFDLRVTREGVVAEVACETVSAEEGRPVHRGDWCALVDRVHPELQTWLAAHPGRYLLKMTLPEGLSGPDKAVELQGAHHDAAGRTEAPGFERRRGAEA